MLSVRQSVRYDPGHVRIIDDKNVDQSRNTDDPLARGQKRAERSGIVRRRRDQTGDGTGCGYGNGCTAPRAAGAVYRSGSGAFWQGCTRSSGRPCCRRPGRCFGRKFWHRPVAKQWHAEPGRLARRSGGDFTQGDGADQLPENAVGYVGARGNSPARFVGKGTFRGALARIGRSAGSRQYGDDPAPGRLVRYA